MYSRQSSQFLFYAGTCNGKLQDASGPLMLLVNCPWIAKRYKIYINERGRVWAKNLELIRWPIPVRRRCCRKMTCVGVGSCEVFRNQAIDELAPTFFKTSSRKCESFWHYFLSSWMTFLVVETMFNVAWWLPLHLCH